MKQTLILSINQNSKQNNEQGQEYTATYCQYSKIYKLRLADQNIKLKGIASKIFHFDLV